METSIRWSRLVTLIAGGAVATLGLTVIAGWHTHSETILQPLPGLIAPVYNTALSFLLCGAGLMAIALGRPVLAIPCAGLSAILGLLNLVEHASGVDLGIDQLLIDHFITTKTSYPGRMAPNTAICFVLTAIALLLAGGQALPKQRPPIVGLLGSVIVALGTVAFSGYLLGVKTYGWGSFLPMAPHTAIGFAILGVGVMAAAWRDGLTEAQGAPRWMPIPVGVAAATATLCLWQPLGAQAHGQVERTVEVEAAGVKMAIESALDARVAPLIGMARRWEERGKPSKAAWELDAELIIGPFADFQVVAWVDPTMHSRWVIPAAGNPAERDRDLAREPRRYQVLTEARDRRVTRLLRADEGGGDGSLLLIGVPIFARGDFNGSILGVIRLRDLFAAVLTEDLAPRYAIIVSDSAGELFGRGTDSRYLAEEWGREEKVGLHGVSWHVRVWPRPEQLALSRSSVPEAVMVAGGLMALLLAWAVHLVQTSRQRALEVESANLRLGREVAERTEAQEAVRKTTENLTRTLDAIRAAVSQLASTSAELLASTSQQAAGLQQQAAAVSQTVSTVDQVANSSEQAAQRARRVGETIQHTLEIGRAGRKAVEEASSALEIVKEQVETTAERICQLAERAQAIGEIIATVTDIAEQTNILALNAAIEASRAGEHGRGFAVVAREVKALAEQSKKATVQVRQILGEIQKATNTSVIATEEATKGVAAAIQVGGQAGEAIKTLAETLAETARAVAQIVASSTQLAIGMTQVNQAMKSVDQVERQNDAAIRQFEQAAQDLNALSTRLAALAAT
jgi:methyl-accepting chemotaxis protein